MAEILLRPDPSSFPPGTTVKVYARALPERGGQLVGQPPGTLLSEPVVAANGSLTVTGVEEGHRYVAWAQTGGSDRYLFFEVAEVPPTGGGEPPTATATRKAYIATGIVGAETQSRYAGATASGHPTVGTFAVGDYVIDLTGTVWICTAGGTPGTWASPSGGAGGLLAANNLSDVQSVATARGNLLAAPLASPALTGTPTAPTAGALTNTTQLATTAYADGAVGVEKGRAEGVEAVKAPLASPALTGVPTAPTAAGGTNTTQLATTAYALAAAVAAEAAAIAAKKKGRISHTFAILGTVTAVVVPGFFISLAAGETRKLVKVKLKITEGTEVACKLQVNGVDATGFTGLKAKTVASEATGEVTLAEGDLVTVVLESATGTPKNLSVTVTTEATI